METKNHKRTALVALINSHLDSITERVVSEAERSVIISLLADKLGPRYPDRLQVVGSCLEALYDVEHLKCSLYFADEGQVVSLSSQQEVWWRFAYGDNPKQIEDLRSILNSEANEVTIIL